MRNLARWWTRAATALVAASAPLAVGAQSADAPPPDLSQVLQQDAASSKAQAGVGVARATLIRDTGLTFGAQAGLTRTTYLIQERIKKEADTLDRIYVYPALMLDGNVLPPSVAAIADVYEQTGDDLLRVINSAYRIQSQPSFRSVPPTWRTFLTRDPKSLQAPGGSARIKIENDKEQAVWEAAVREGYAQGEKQAYAILNEDLARLRSHFLGIVCYRTLLAEGMVTRPYVAESRLGVTGVAKSSMNVGETVLRISVKPEFILKDSDWRQPFRYNTPNVCFAAGKR